MKDAMFIHEQNAAMIASFRSMVDDVSDIEAALIQIALEEGCDALAARAKLESLLGNLEEFVGSK